MTQTMKALAKTGPVQGLELIDAPVPEAGLAPFVPRITLTFPALASARETLVLVTGAGKQEPLRRLARGEDLPVRHLRSVGRLVWLVDQEAAGA